MSTPRPPSATAVPVRRNYYGTSATSAMPHQHQQRPMSSSGQSTTSITRLLGSQQGAAISTTTDRPLSASADVNSNVIPHRPQQQHAAAIASSSLRHAAAATVADDDEFSVEEQSEREQQTVAATNNKKQPGKEDSFDLSGHSSSSNSVLSNNNNNNVAAVPVRRPLSRPASSSGGGAQPYPPQQPAKRSSLATAVTTFNTPLPTPADHCRRFLAVETSARGNLLADEAEARSVVHQWLKAQLYQAVSRENMRRRAPMRTIVAATAASSTSPERTEHLQRKQQQEQQEQKEQHDGKNAEEQPQRQDFDEKLMQEILGGVVPYRSYTERAGRLWSSRKQRAAPAITDKPSAAPEEVQQQQQQQQSTFEQKLAASRHSGAFELDGLAHDKELARQQQQRELDRRDPTRHMTPRTAARAQLEALEMSERAVFIATMFLPEMLRCIEDAERIERSGTEAKREKELATTRSEQYSVELKPLMEVWRKREHSALTIQCAFRRIQRGSFGWHRTHKQLGYEIESMRREKKQQREQQQQQSVVSSNNNNPRNTRLQQLNAIQQLEREAELEVQRRNETQVKSFLAAVSKDREDVAFEERWCLQRELQFMSSNFFDTVTKPAMHRVCGEETSARTEFADKIVDEEFSQLLEKFITLRFHIQRKNDCEALETSQRSIEITSIEQQEFNTISNERKLHLGNTIERVNYRHKNERDTINNAEQQQRSAINDEMIESATNAFAWHCAVVDDSLFVFEQSQRAFLQSTFFEQRQDIITEQTQSLLSCLASQCITHLSTNVICLGRLHSLSLVFEPLWRRDVRKSEDKQFTFLQNAAQPTLAGIRSGASKRVAAARTIQKYWRAFKRGGEIGRSGRLKYFDEKFASKKRAAARKRAAAIVAETQADLANALREANIHIVAGFSQKLRLLQKQETRTRGDLETEDELMRRIFDANMVSVIAATCTSETTVLARFEAYHRFQIVQEERDRFVRHVTFMELVFVKDVKIRPAQRAVRCFLARQARRRRIAEAIVELQVKQQVRRVALQMDHLSSVVDLFAGNILHSLYKVSFASATFVWVTEQERAARECILLERAESARGYVGVMVSLGKDAITEQQQREFRYGILAEWQKQVFFLDLFELEVNERDAVVTQQSELATQNLLGHVENLRRMLQRAAHEKQSFELAMSALELHEGTQRAILIRDAVSVGYGLLVHNQEADQRSILQRHLLHLCDLNTTIYQRESEARDEIRRQYATGVTACVAAYEQDTRFAIMRKEHNEREQWRVVAFEDDWRKDVEAERRYELLMLVELAESGRRKVFLLPEMRALERIVDFNRDCIRKKGFLFDSDYCHGMRAILEAQQHEQRMLIAADERDYQRYLQEQQHIAERMFMEQEQSKRRGQLQHIEHAKFEHIMRNFTRLSRNANYRAADVVWRNCATRALMGNGIAPTQPTTTASANAASSSPTQLVENARAAAINNAEYDIQSDFRKITRELLYTMRTRIMQSWLRIHATELALLHHQSMGHAFALSIEKEVTSVTNMMHGILARDPFHQTMKLVYQLRCKRDELWAEQAGELATVVFSSDAWLRPCHESLFHLEARSVLDRLLQRRERGVVEIAEDSGIHELLHDEKFSRRVLLLVESERAERVRVSDSERADFDVWMVDFQDTILKPLETIRNERSLRALYGEVEEQSERKAIEEQFAEEIVLCWGPQRAWWMLKAREKIKKEHDDRQSFLRMEERRRAVRAALDAADNNRTVKAAVMMQRWARRRLWLSRWANDGAAVAGALAVSDALHEEVFGAIDVRDRYERLKYCAVLVQKVFRGHRVRKPLAARLEAAKQREQQRQQQNEQQQEQQRQQRQRAAAEQAALEEAEEL